MRHLWSLGLSALLFGCGGVEGEAPLDEQTEIASEEITPGSPVLNFYQGWSRAQTGTLVAGDKVRVVYENGRLPDCRGTTNTGGPAFTITAFARVNGGAVVSRPIWGASPDGTALTGQAIFDLPAAGELQLWFQITNRWGCSQFDSDFGRNYRYPIGPAPTATIRFAADFSERVTGTLTRGGAVNIDYALSRLPNCRQGYSGAPTWEILAYYRFDGGAVQQTVVTRPSGSDRISVLTPILIPSNARNLELWFFNSDRGGCRQYDSDFGANYRFAIR